MPHQVYNTYFKQKVNKFPLEAKYEVSKPKRCMTPSEVTRKYGKFPQTEVKQIVYSKNVRPEFHKNNVEHNLALIHSSNFS